MRDLIQVFLIDRQNRRDDGSQKSRRHLLAVLRNFLWSLALQPKHYGVLWLDADIVAVPDDVLGKLVASGKDIVTPNCAYDNDRQFKLSFDLNAWKGARNAPSPDQLALIRNNEPSGFVPSHGPGTLFLHQIRELYHDEYVEIDSVGGTALFVKSEVYRSGIAFSTSWEVGRGWGHEGWDGIETEGLCVVAKASGFKCWAMPYQTVYHSPEGCGPRCWHADDFNRMSSGQGLPGEKRWLA
jgi:hypothetical protein